METAFSRFEFEGMQKRKRKGVSAWLVTWEWSGDHAKQPNKVAEILDPRTQPERVRQIVELLYHRDALLTEKISWRLRKRAQVYPAEFLTLEGVKWTGEITCGHNPWLRARLVNNLLVETDADGKEVAIWNDRHNPREIRKVFRKISR